MSDVLEGIYVSEIKWNVGKVNPEGLLRFINLPEVVKVSDGTASPEKVRLWLEEKYGFGVNGFTFSKVNVNNEFDQLPRRAKLLFDAKVDKAAVSF